MLGWVEGVSSEEDRHNQSSDFKARAGSVGRCIQITYLSTFVWNVFVGAFHLHVLYMQCVCL